jgi:hypothetical protein
MLIIGVKSYALILDEGKINLQLFLVWRLKKSSKKQSIRNSYYLVGKNIAKISITTFQLIQLTNYNSPKSFVKTDNS